MANTLRAVIAGTVGIAVLAVAARCARAQSATDQPKPYASIASKGVDYAGPGREAAYDLTGETISIGLIVPLSGARKADGEAIVAAARMALADAGRDALPGARKLALKTGDESGPSWSGVTTALTHLVFDEQAVALITSSSGATAHLSEQVGNRIGVPVLTLASDKTTTEIDLPWIFRLGPTDSLEARTIAENIYRNLGLQRVLLVTENDHDGRRGLSEFQDAARALDAPVPASLVFDPARADVDAFADAVRAQSPQAIVLWTKSPAARTLIAAAQARNLQIPVYLSEEATQNLSGVDPIFSDETANETPNQPGLWTVVTVGAGSPVREGFARRYKETTGAYPSAAAAETYDAVRLVASAFREAGPNRARVRDRIAMTRNWQGASGTISFDAEGNNAVQVRLVHLPSNMAAGEMTRRN